ncbi:Galectin-9C [Bienertia sinuspersici]
MINYNDKINSNSWGNQDRLIPKRGQVKAGILLAVAHYLVAFFSIK